MCKAGRRAEPWRNDRPTTRRAQWRNRGDSWVNIGYFGLIAGSFGSLALPTAHFGLASEAALQGFRPYFSISLKPLK
jgi:hypothetical protein